MSENVFAPPRANLETREGTGFLWELDLKKLRTLYNASRTIRTIGILWAIGAVLVTVATIAFGFAAAGGASRNEPAWLIPFLLVSAALSAVGTWTAFSRPGWGRPLGIVLNVLGLINFPIGTIIGLFGLVAYVQGKSLFGPDKILHNDLVEVYKQRKKEKK